MTHAHDPAYPVPFDTEIAAKEGQGSRGLTKREAFAMAALAVVGSSHPQVPHFPQEAAEYVVAVADALLAELAKDSPMTPADKLEAGLIDTIAAVLELKLGLPWQEAEPAARAVADAIRAELGEAEPRAWITTVKCAGPSYGEEHYGKWPIQSLQPGYYAHTPLFTTPPASVSVEALQSYCDELNATVEFFNTRAGHRSGGRATARIYEEVAHKLTALIAQEKP